MWFVYILRCADALHAPFDIFLVRKLGVPGHRELAMGAIASGGIRVLNDAVIRAIPISAAQIEAVAAAEELELARREAAYRTGRAALDLAGKIVVLVDDGLATGSTMRAAVDAVRSRRPERIVVGVPVGAVQTCADLGSVADEVVCMVAPESFQAVGQWYVDFSQTSDDEVRALLGPELT